MLGSDYTNSAQFLHDFVMANTFSATGLNINVGNGPSLKNSHVASGTPHETPMKKSSMSEFRVLCLSNPATCSLMLTNRMTQCSLMYLFSMVKTARDDAVAARWNNNTEEC